MKILSGLLFFGLTALGSTLLLGCVSPEEQPAEATAEVANASVEVTDTAVRHVVIFKYKETATDAQIQEITDAFKALKDQIPGIIDFEHGVNDSPEGKNLGFTHAYLMTFENAEARDVYLPHPKHAEFGKLLGESGIFEDAFVVDYSPMR